MTPTCKHARATSETCGCKNDETLVECQNVRRVENLDERTDAARNHAKTRDGRAYVRARFCAARWCVDFEEGEAEEMSERCKNATFLERKWGTGSCVVVECRSARALNDSALSFVDDKGRVWDVGAIRKPCDENFNLIPGADCLHIRSRFCNKVACKYYERD